MTADWTVWGAALIVIVSIIVSLWLVVVADIVRRWWREVPLSWWLDRQARQRRKAIAAIEQLMEDERQKLRRVAEWKRR